MSLEPIVFPDVEDLLVTYLTGEYALRGETASVHTAVPNPRPDRFVLVPRLGGQRLGLVVDAPTIGLETWALTDGQAASLMGLTRALIGALPGQALAGHQIYGVEEFAGPGNLPDPLSTHGRYVYTVSIRIRGHALT